MVVHRLRGLKWVVEVIFGYSGTNVIRVLLAMLAESHTGSNAIYGAHIVLTGGPKLKKKECRNTINTWRLQSTYAKESLFNLPGSRQLRRGAKPHQEALETAQLERVGLRKSVAWHTESRSTHEQCISVHLYSSSNCLIYQIGLQFYFFDDE